MSEKRKKLYQKLGGKKGDIFSLSLYFFAYIKISKMFKIKLKKIYIYTLNII